MFREDRAVLVTAGLTMHAIAIIGDSEDPGFSLGVCDADDGITLDAVAVDAVIGNAGAVHTEAAIGFAA
jgi:hypothetical protein